MEISDIHIDKVNFLNLLTSFCNFSSEFKIVLLIEII